MSDNDKPPKPHPDCVWDERAGVWRWPDDRDPEQRAADELAAELGETGQWAQGGFRREHTARIDSR